MVAQANYQVNNLAEKIQEIISGSGKCCHQVRVKPYPSDPNGFTLQAPKAFAWPLWQGSKKRLKIEVKKRWADKLGLTKSADSISSKGNFTEPAVYWYLAPDDDYVKNLGKVAAILAWVCETRHHDC